MSGQKVTLREQDGKLVFGNSELGLVFSLQDGRWTETVRHGKNLMQGAVDELELTIGGVMRSSISDEHLNKTWARLQLEGGEVRTVRPVLKGYELVREQSAAVLSIRSEADGFAVTKHYALSYTGILERSFTIRSQMEKRVALRKVDMRTPLLVDLDVCENLGGYSNALAITHNARDTQTLAMWGGALRNEVSRFVSQPVDGGNTLANTTQLAAWIEPGEAHHFGSTFFAAGDMPWRDMLLLVRDEWEQKGCRTTIGDKSHLKNLLILETEIGHIHFRPDKDRHVYPALSDLQNDLPRLKAIGYNAVQLMPSFPFPGYSVYDLMRPEQQHSLGADLKPFIRKAHSMGIRVLFDVLMHGFIDKEIARYNREHYIPRKHYYPAWEEKSEYEVTPFRAEHPDWFVYEESGDIFKVYTWSIDWANREAQDYLIRALTYYVQELDIDGFRFDAPTWVNAPTWADNLPYRADKALFGGVWETFQRARQAIDLLKEKLVWITEPENISLRDVVDVSYTYSTQGIWKQLWTGEKKGRDLQDFYAVRKRIQPKGALYVNWLDNHDSWNDGTNETGLYAVELYNVEFARALLVISLFQEGAYMAYAGNEKLDPEYYAKLLQLYNRMEIFTKGRCCFERCKAEDENVYVCHWEYCGEQVVVAANLSNGAVTTRIHGMNGSFVDLIEGGNVDAPCEIALPAYGARLYWRQ